MRENVELRDPGPAVAEIGAELSSIESRLIDLTREGGAGARPLDEVIAELVVLAQRIAPLYARLQDALEKRDLTYEAVTKVEELRKRALWLYRRSRLEHVFYSKLQLERSLRDTLYRQVLDAYDDLSVLEIQEARLRGISEPELAADLLQEPGQSAE